MNTDNEVNIESDGKVDIISNLKSIRKFSQEISSNRPVFAVFENYFNLIFQKPELNESIKILAFEENDQINNSYLSLNHLGSSSVICSYKNLLVCISFNCFRNDSEIFFNIFISSNKETEEKTDDFFRFILEEAIKLSDLKGSYLVMNNSCLDWEVSRLEKKSFNDIFLPDELINNLKLYLNVYAKSQIILRYLSVGIPGSGKTESALVLANELQKFGVTIIKTKIDGCLRDKIDFAEMLAPSMILFDDIDLSIGSRKEKSYNPEFLANFLDILDGTKKLPKNVGIIATTNSAELIDIAAQRPGRFNKIIFFNNITKENIKNIILKSLKYEFSLIKKEETKIYTDDEILDLLYKNKVTGSYVYNIIKMLRLKDSSSDSTLTVKDIIKEINEDLKMIEIVKNTSILKETFDAKESSIGFRN